MKPHNLRRLGFRAKCVYIRVHIQQYVLMSMCKCTHAHTFCPKREFAVLLEKLQRYEHLRTGEWFLGKLQQAQLYAKPSLTIVFTLTWLFLNAYLQNHPVLPKPLLPPCASLGPALGIPETDPIPMFHSKFPPRRHMPKCLVLFALALPGLLTQLLGNASPTSLP